MKVPMHVIVALRLAECTGAVTSGNRRSWTVRAGDAEYTVVRRDTTKPDGYERTELFNMLTTLRIHEQLQHWRCPEPDTDFVSKAVRQILGGTP